MPIPESSDVSSATGSITLLFTDIEGSTRLWEEHGPLMSRALAEHDALARSAVNRHRGKVVKMIGDGMHAVFAEPIDAIAATIDLLCGLEDSSRTEGLALRLRCGLHCGVVEHRDDDTFGSQVNRAARIMSAAHGGQVLVSQAVVDLVRDSLPASLRLRDLGRVMLRDLSVPEQVYQVLHPDLRQDFPALRSLEATPNNLPEQTTRFIGRTAELDELGRLLASSRVLTLTGAGGSGKTRLGLHLAASVVDRFPDGVWLVELAALREAEWVARATAAVLGVRDEPGKTATQSLVGILAGRRTLILLDNCEHLVASADTLVDTLLRQCADVRVVATSREALGIPGEQTFRVPSLSVPRAERTVTMAGIAAFESVQLFVDRASLARPGFALDDRNAPSIASICARLDGIPLAIELAAARVRSLAADEIERRLDQRFRLLTGGSRTALPRHQTLRALIDWSYDLLDEPAQRLLEQLSVFSGGFALDAAEAVCGDEGEAAGVVLDVLASLVDKSLVAIEEYGSASRYRLVETVRDYAREKLSGRGGDESLRGRHLRCFLALVEIAQANLQSAGQAEWLERLERDHDNLRSALEWCLRSNEVATGMRLCGLLQRFWIARGYHSEGRTWCERLLVADAAHSAPAERAMTLNCLGLLAYQQGEFAFARARFEDRLAICRALGDRRAIAISLNNLGMVALDEGDYASAVAFHEESLGIARELGNSNGVARSLGNLGMIAHRRHDLEEARRLFEQSLLLMRELGDREGTALILHGLGDVAREAGDYSTARHRFGEGLAILRELGHRMRIAYSLQGLADALHRDGGEPSSAIMLWGAAERLQQELGLQSLEDEVATAARAAAARRGVADGLAFDRAWRSGRAMSLEEVLDLASDVSRAG
jgi:predicted ATPase/class 3 adenylate cyclase